MTRKICADGIRLLKSFEQGPAGGPALEAYLCPAGKWTIGWGHSGPDVGPDRRITESEANELLAADCRRFERIVSTRVQVPLTAAQFAALVCFAFNVGEAAFRRSTLLRRLNEGDYGSVPDQIRRWTKGRNGQGESIVLPGLVRRRAAEAELWGR